MTDSLNYFKRMNFKLGVTQRDPTAQFTLNTKGAL